MAERYNFKYLPLVGKLPGKSMVEQTETAINELASVVYDNVGHAGNLAEEVKTANTNASNALDKATEALETSSRVYIKQIAAVDVNDYYDSELYYIDNDGSTNIPVRDRGFLEVKTNDDKTDCEQVFIADSTGTPYYRHGRITKQTLGEETTYVVTWGSWYRVATTEYVQGELTNYLPLSGGSITGDVNITGDLSVSGAIYSSSLPFLNNAGAHNSIYRGKYLGDHVTDEQYDAIDAGTFEGLFIGDYWVINGVNWRIAAFDYWLHCGDTECTTHHVVIVPDTNLATCQMNNSNVTTGAYIGSNFYTGANSNTGKATANTAINNAFGSSHILTHREYLQNAVTNGYESGGTWYDSKFELMTERMVYGCDIFHNTVNGTNIPSWYSIDKSQLPLFALEPSRITNRANWWLRDVVSAANFANVSYDGLAHYITASASRGVRPAFAIKK